MKVTDQVIAYHPKCAEFSREEVELLLALLNMKLKYSTDNEKPMIEGLIEGFLDIRLEIITNEHDRAMT